MKKVVPKAVRRFLINAIFGTLMIVSCDDEKGAIMPSVIQFSASLQNVAEGAELTLLLTLDRPASNNGSVELTLETNAVYGQHFTTDPAVDNNSIILQIAKGEKSAEFKIRTVDNKKYEGTKFIIFQLKTRSGDFKSGDIAALTLTIGDDEGPSVANFAISAGTLNETAGNGILVEIPFSAPAQGEGSLTVTLAAGTAINGTNFTIDQEVINNAFSFNVVKNTAGVSFRIAPVNNDLFTGDFLLAFDISEASGVVQKGNNLRYTLKIVDDETRALARFAATSGTLAETGEEGIVVEILLSTPAKGEGTLAISFSSENLVYGNDFTTLPEASGTRISLDFSHNQTSSSFKVFPKNNDLLHGHRTLLISIPQSTGIVGGGTDGVGYELTLVDDEKPSVATFAVSTATIDERNTEGIEVQIQFSHPTPGTGQIIMDVEGFANQFISDPEVDVRYHYDSYSSDYFGYYTYHLTLDVPLHTTAVSFKILPINDNRCSVNPLTTFSISSVGGAITKDMTPKFELTIDDDEDAMIVTLPQTAGTLSEDNSGGASILLTFSKPAVRDGTLWVSLNHSNMYHSGRYTTSPGMQYYSGDGDYAPLVFRKGDNGVVFKVFPVNDNIAKDAFTEDFHFSYQADQNTDDGCVQILDKTYTLTFEDDD